MRRSDPTAEGRSGVASATHLWRALEELARQRATIDRDALVVLVTDGRDPERGDLALRGAQARERLHAARAKLAVIAAGADSDRELLRTQHFLDGLGPPRSCFYRCVIGHDDDWTTVHFADTRDNTRSRRLTVVLVVGEE